MGDEYRYVIRTAVVLITLLSIVTRPVQSVAEEDEKALAKRHFEAGKRLYKTDDFNGAATAFETAVKLYPTESGYFNLANCYKALHRYADTLRVIETLEHRFGDALNPVLLEKTNIVKNDILAIVGEITISVTPPEAEVSIGDTVLSASAIGHPLILGPGNYRIKVRKEGFNTVVQTVSLTTHDKKAVHITLLPTTGQLTVQANKKGASVIINGSVLGTTPLVHPVSLSPDAYDVTVALEGYTSVTRRVHISPSSNTTLDVQLMPRNAPAEAALTPASPANAQKMSSRRTPPLTIVGISSAAAVACASGIFFGIAARYASDFDTQNQAYVDAPTDALAEVADSKRHDAADDSRRFARLGLGFGIAAGVLTVSTIVYTIISRKRAGAPSNETASVHFGARFFVTDF